MVSTMARSILLVDDDARVLESLQRVLSRTGASVTTAESAEGALAKLSALRPDLIISDVRMPGMSGLDLLALVRERAPEVDFVLMTAYEDLATVAGAMQGGAADFLVKPLDLHQLRAVVDRVFRDRADREKAAANTEPGDEAHDGAAAPVTPRPTLVGKHPAMIEVFKRIGQVAGSATPVVIRGESGTGKELIARAIHDLSPRAAEPFVAVNCASLPETLLESELFGHVRGAFTGADRERKGRFETAGRGTILLDEIGDTSPEFQAKLLRVLQEGEYYPVGSDEAKRSRARVLAATHRDLEAGVEDGTFRKDLYYRLRVVELRLPPLRERTEDIPLLAGHLLALASESAGRTPPRISSEAMERLQSHAWPGNVRELENCLARAAVMATGDVIRPEHLALAPGGAPASPDRVFSTLDEMEYEHVTRVLEATGGNKSRAAEILGISRPRLRRILERSDDA
jgi:DNA-binding NtrC family response regulator